jgi:hypothetical protein
VTSETNTLPDRPRANGDQFDPVSHLQNAVQLVSKQDQITWTVFNIFWPANALLLVALFTTGRLPSRLVGIVVCAVGLALSVVWTVIQFRAMAHLEFYEAIVNRIEKSYLRVPVDIALSGRLNTDLFTDKMSGTLPVRALMRAIGVTSSILWFVALLWFVFCIQAA